MEQKQNIFAKLTKARVILTKREIVKSGRNDYSHYDYYELSDYMPHILEINEEVGLCSFVTFEETEQGEMGVLTLVDLDNLESTLRFTMKLKDITLKACNAMQNEGAKHTFARRYLYIDAYELSENDPSETPEQTKDNVKTEEQLKKEKENAIKELKSNSKKAGFTIEQVIEKFNKETSKSINKIEDMPVKRLVGYNKLMLITIDRNTKKAKKQVN